MVVSHGDMQTLIEGFETFLVEGLNRQTSTVTRYVTELKSFATFLSADAEALDLGAATKTVIEQFLRQRAEKDKPSPARRNLRLAALRAFYLFLREAELMRSDPTEQLKRQRLVSNEPVPLSLDEYLALVDAAEQSSPLYRSRNVAMVQVFYHCSLRVSELVSLKLRQLDFERYQFSQVRRKGGKKFISMPFSDLVAEALQRYLADRERFGPREGEQALFLSDRGRGVAIRSAQEIIRQCARQAGIIRSVGPHLVRHSGPTELADRGTPLPEVQDLLDHEDIGTTRRYTHSKADARRRAVNKLDEVVKKHQQERKRREEVVPA